MEPTEISEFSKEMKEAGESALTHVSLAISVLAVLVAMVTVLGHREHTEAVLMQARATDTWNEYQARNIRSTMTSRTADMLTLQPSANSDAVKDKLEEYAKQQEKWKDELKDDSEKAKEYESEVEVAEKKAVKFDMGEALLQIAVVLASITLLTRRQTFFVGGLALGIVGAVIAALGFLGH
jgi:hypothetical protein